MNKIKEISLATFLAVACSGLSAFFSADGTLLGSFNNNVVYRGFPFHFYEAFYSEARHINFLYDKFLAHWFLADFIFYLIVLISFRYLYFLGIKMRNQYILGITFLLGAISVMVNIGTNDSCVAGFPVEFYARCVPSEISTTFVVYGLCLNFIFWLSLCAVCMAVLHKLFTLPNLKQFFIYKSAWVTVISAWVTVAVLSLLGTVADMGGVLGAGIILAVVTIPGLINFYKFRKKNMDSGKRLFLSTWGYATFGIAAGVVIVSTIFNLAYEGGWFDFTDIGFALLSYPLSYFINSKFYNETLQSRLILYVIDAVNIILVIFIMDILGFILTKGANFFKDKNIK